MNNNLIKYKIGCNFDYKLLEFAKNTNDVFENRKITEMYGSDQQHHELTARPKFRLIDIKPKELEKYIKCCNDNNIEFNYTLNSIYLFSKRELYKKSKKIIKFVEFLSDIGVKRITISNPIILEFIHNIGNLKFEISTIAHIDTVTQIKYYLSKYHRIDKICGNILKNRSIKFLKNAVELCKKMNCSYELLVNEFCGVSNGISTTHCVYRDSCYLCHSENQTISDKNLFSEYPMGYCINSRNSYRSNWLKLRWIRPEDLCLYTNLGITNFKISGRTGTTEYITKIAQAYVSGIWNDNLLKLWKPLETITLKDTPELEFNHPHDIDNQKLNSFVYHWFNNLDFDCCNEICGHTCKYCDEFSDTYL